MVRLVWICTGFTWFKVSKNCHGPIFEFVESVEQGRTGLNTQDFTTYINIVPTTCHNVSLTFE